MNVPFFDGAASSPPSYEPNFRVGPAEASREFVAVYEQHCAESFHDGRQGSYWGNDGARRISRILQGRFAPDAIDSISQGVATFMNFKRADRTTDAFLMEFDMLR